MHKSRQINWKTKKLDCLCNIQSGGTPSRTRPEYYQGDIPWITTVALGPLYIDQDSANEFITAEAIQASATKVMKKGAILFGSRVGVGKLSITRCNMSINQDILGLTLKDESCDIEYLARFLESQLSYFTHFKRGATIQGIKSEVLKDLDVPLPPLQTQKKIADVLDQAQVLIDKRKEQIAALDDFIKSVFLDMFGDPARNPMGWQFEKLEKICLKITDGTHQSPQFVSQGIPFLFVSNIVNNRINYNTEKYITEADYYTLIKRTPIQIGDILYTIVGSYGNPAVVKDSQKFCFQRHIAYIKPNRNLIESNFLFAALLSEFVKQQVDRKVRGVAQKTLNLSELKVITIPVPPLDLQYQFSTILEETEQQKEKMQQSLVQMELAFNSLMQKAFRGELFA